MSIWNAFNEGQRTVLMKNQQDMDQARQDALLAIQNKKLKMDESGQQFDQKYKTDVYNQQVSNDQRNFDFTKQRADIQDKQFEMTAFASPEALLSMNKSFGTNYAGNEKITWNEVSGQTGIKGLAIQEEMKRIALSQAGDQMAHNRYIRQTDADNKKLAFTKIGEFTNLIKDLSANPFSSPADLEGKPWGIGDFLAGEWGPGYGKEQRIAKQESLVKTIASLKNLKDVVQGKNANYQNITLLDLTSNALTSNLLSNAGVSANYMYEQRKDLGLTKEQIRDLKDLMDTFGQYANNNPMPVKE